MDEENNNITHESVNEKKQQEPIKQKNNKNGFIISLIIIIIAIILGSIGGFIYANNFSKTEIDLSKYVTINFKGYDGSASFDEYDVEINEKELKKILDDKKLASKLVNKLADKIIVKENDHLKNGDTVEVKFKISENWLKENKIKIISNTVKIKVKDLKEASSINLFEDLEFNYSGISPNLTITLNNNSTDDFLKYYVTYKMDNGKDSSYYSLYNIANGDKIKITASFDKKDMENAGYNIKDGEDEYTFTVNEQTEYINKADDVTSKIKESINPKLLEKAKTIVNNSSYDIVNAYYDDFYGANHYDYNLTNTDPELQKMYIAVNKDFKNANLFDYKNTIFALYKVVFTDTTTSKTYDYYIAVKVDDIAANKDGLYTDTTYYYDEFYNYNYKPADGSDYHKTIDNLYKAIENKTGENYTITEIK